MSVSPAILDTVGRLVAFDSTSRKSNLHIIDYLKETLSGLGADCRLTHDDEGKKARDRPGAAIPISWSSATGNCSGAVRPT
jgi:hypothetical protein